jgi:hypothetical protein
MEVRSRMLKRYADRTPVIGSRGWMEKTTADVRTKFCRTE